MICKYPLPALVIAICAASAILSGNVQGGIETRSVQSELTSDRPERLLVAAAPRRKKTTPSAPQPTVSAAPAAASRVVVEPIAGMEFLPIPAGCFQMGDSSGDADEKPVHQVCLDAFSIGKFEVTQAQWLRVTGSVPSFFSSCGAECPVESVSWNDVQGFIGSLNRLSGRNYRLPTEAEWEYACRSGGKSERFCGGTDVAAAAWYDRNSSSKPHPVGGKQPNGLGIYDMSGNVWEWVGDWYQKEYYSIQQEQKLGSPLAGNKRGMRGGSWYNDAKNVRSSIRGSDDPDHRSINLGFRLAYSTR